MRSLVHALFLALMLSPMAFATNRYVPAASYSPGANGTFWRTDLRIYNPSSERPLEVTLHFLPRGMDGQNIPGRVYHIPKNGTLVMDNAAATLWPTVPAVGAIRIDSDTDMSYPFVAGSRTYTNSPDAARPGTYGQFVPAFEAVEARASTALLLVASSSDLRTNAGVMNPGRESLTVTMKLAGPDGVIVAESAPRTVFPMSMEQWSIEDLFGGVFLSDGVILVEATAPVISWASVIDNLSGDAIFVRGIERDDTVEPLPAP